MSELDVTYWANRLRDYATHFEMRDWNYTRIMPRLKHIRYETDYSGYDHPLRRIKRWLECYVPRKRSTWCDRVGWELAWKHPIIHARCSLQTRNHLPDGWLDDGGILTHWEETGEYLQYVQPSVGALLADLMEAHPDLPEVVTIAAEMKRISDAYRDRCKRGEVDAHANDPEEFA